MSAELWREPIVPLERLATAFGFRLEMLSLNESADEINYTDSLFEEAKLALPVDPQQREQKLAEINSVLLAQREKYGEALTLEFSIHGSDQLIVDAEYDRAKLNTFYETIPGSVVLTLAVKIDKAKLLEHWGFRETSALLKLFLFPGALARNLSASLLDLEQGEKGLLKNCTGEQKLIILAPGWKGTLDGDYLAILGKEAVANSRDYVPALPPNKERVEYIRTEAIKKLRWMYFEFKHLTPLQLLLSIKTPVTGEEAEPNEVDPIARALYSQLLACSLLYMAGNSVKKSIENETGQRDDHWLVTFAANKDVAEVEFGNAQSLGQIIAEVSKEKFWKPACTVSNLALWIYEATSQGKRDVRDRVVVLQSAIASALQNPDPKANCTELVHRAGEISKRVEGGWASFIEGKLEKYFSQVKELEVTVESAKQTYNEQVQTLTKTLIDNMLAAVGVVVGSFIAAILKSPFEAYIFWFGTGIYLGYLIVFPIGVGLISAWQHFGDAQKAFQKREEVFGKRLSPEDVTEIVGSTVKNSEGRFIKWFCATVVLYVVVVFLVLVAMVKVPREIRKWTDNFELTSVSYDEPANSDVVPLVIRGQNFDKDKEIAVTIGDSVFTNTDGQTLKVHGSTALRLSPQQEELAVQSRANGFVFVRQGSTEAKRLSLPSGPAPIPQPVFERWNLRNVSTSGVLEAYGTNFGSISEIRFDSKKINFTVSNNSLKLELGNLSEGTWAGKSLEVTLKNGQTFPEIISAVSSTKEGAIQK
jgi:hypothetical protein